MNKNQTVKKLTIMLNCSNPEMGSLVQLLGLILWVFFFFHSSKSVVSGAGTVEGSVFIDGRVAIGKIDDDFICATLDWWPPEKCDYGSCSWGRASLLNLVFCFYPSNLIDVF